MTNPLTKEELAEIRAFLNKCTSGNSTAKRVMPLLNHIDSLESQLQEQTKEIERLRGEAESYKALWNDLARKVAEAGEK